jgi:hypothetical protein
MCKDRVVFLVAGLMIGVGVLLAWQVSLWWLLLPAFVSVNMVQASLTCFCPLTKILNAMRVPACSSASPLK